ncbi:MAG: adenine phosphoribosyltransferase [Thermoguttaceae bacterium]
MPEKTSPNLLSSIRSIPDFPKPGILFYDITPLLGNPQAFREAVHELAERARPLNVDLVVAAEARGFLFAAPVAVDLGVGLVPVRKPGKLPYKTMSHTYELEYGSDTLEIHVDAIPQGARVLIVDDLLATGGTVDACRQLVENAGGSVVGCAFLIELVGLGGAKKVGTPEIISLLKLD